MKKIYRHEPWKNIGVVSNSLGYVIGTYLSDGWNMNERIIGLTVKDKDFALEFKRHLEMWSGLPCKIKEYNGWGNAKGKYYRVSLNSIRGTKFLIYLVRDYWDSILNFPIKVKCNILRGLFDGDGGVGLSNINNRKKIVRNISFTNTDFEIISLVKEFLNELRIKNSVYSRIHSGFGGRKILYTISITGLDNITNFHQRINFSIKRKRDKLIELLRTYNKYPYKLEKIR